MDENRGHPETLTALELDVLRIAERRGHYLARHFKPDALVERLAAAGYLRPMSGLSTFAPGYIITDAGRAILCSSAEGPNPPSINPGKP